MRMCGIFISGLAEPFFKIGFLVKKSSRIDPEMPEKAIISVFKSYLVHFGSFNAIFCIFVQALSTKFEVIEEKCTKAYYLALFVVSVPTNGSNEAFNVVIRLSFLSFHFSTQRSTFFGEVLNVKYVKKVEKGFLDTAADYKWDSAASEADLRHDFRLSATI